MKISTGCLMLFLCTATILKAQNTPPSYDELNYSLSSQTFLFSNSDTIDFTPYASGVIITNQYLYNGALFEGFNGSSDPLVYDYTSGIGRVLRSDNWYNAIRLNFVDSANSSQYNPVQRIEFDNPVNSQVDYVSVDVFDSLNTLIYHYLSTSPEHVIIDLGTPSGAYITFDDSAGTAYVIDNIYYDYGTTSVNNTEFTTINFHIFPNPVWNECTLSISNYNSSSISISVIDQLGQVVYAFIREEATSTFIETIDLSQLSEGFYLVEVIADGNKVVKKLLKM